MKTTLNKIKEYDPCSYGWEKLLKSLNKTEADNEPLDFLHILNSNGLGDCVWAMRSAPEYDREWRLFSIWCARQVQHLMTDERSVNALNVSERFANGEASSEELAAAMAAAWAAAGAAGAAAGDAAWAAAWAAAGAAAMDAAGAARDAAGAARDAAGAAAMDAAWAAQKNYLITLFTTNT